MEVDRRIGWQEYIKIADAIDLQRQQMGLPNLRVAAASELAALRRQLIGALAQKYPSWWEDFNTRDDLKWDKRITALRTISSEEPLASRADMEGVQQYLELRELILQELNRRKQLGGSSTLEATANQDLANLWDTMVTELLSENIAFGPVYYRYLEGDPLTLRSGS